MPGCRAIWGRGGERRVLVFWLVGGFGGRFFLEKTLAFSLPSTLKCVKMQMLVRFSKEIQSLNASFVFKNGNTGIIQVSNQKAGSHRHSLYLISGFAALFCRYWIFPHRTMPSLQPVYSHSGGHTCSRAGGFSSRRD